MQRGPTWPLGPGASPGALTESEFRQALAAAGLDEVDIRETRRVHEHAAAAIIRARKPPPNSSGPAQAVTGNVGLTDG